MRQVWGVLAVDKPHDAFVNVLLAECLPPRVNTFALKSEIEPVGKPVGHEDIDPTGRLSAPAAKRARFRDDMKLEPAQLLELSHANHELARKVFLF